MKKILVMIVLTVLTCALLSGCEEKTSMDETEPDLSKLLVTLSTDKPSYVVNETVQITVTVTNTGNSNITLTFSDAQVADFEILTEEGEQVYLWSTGRMFAQMITNVTIPAGKTMELLNETWKTTGEGNYTIRSWLPLTSKIYSNAVTIKVQ
ncbi:MAG TPA: hypothetical protein ENI45_04180 [Thermoplasmatales archaeon]|nr:hypothetical protein [Thermoplasmatales archaeon]